MNETIKHKKYIGSVDIDMEERVLHGRVLFIKGLITYESINFDIGELKHEFEEAIDEYLADCGELNIEPEQSCKGLFNVRVSPELHLEANLLAMKNNESLNALVKRAIETEVSDKIINHKHDINLSVEHTVIKKQFESEYGQQQEGKYEKIDRTH